MALGARRERLTGRPSPVAGGPTGRSSDDRDLQFVHLGRRMAGPFEELGITRKTVGSHVEHILAKLGMDRRTEVAAWAASRPVLHSPPSRR